MVQTLLLHYWSALGHQVADMGSCRKGCPFWCLEGMPPALNACFWDSNRRLNFIWTAHICMKWEFCRVQSRLGTHHIYTAGTRRTVWECGPLLKLKMVVNCWVWWCRKRVVHKSNQCRETGLGFIKNCCFFIWFFYWMWIDMDYRHRCVCADVSWLSLRLWPEKGWISS